MGKKLLLGSGLIGAAFAARRCASHCGGFDVEKMIDRMPDNAPPKWLFRNISAIRENTDRILKLLEHEPDAAEKAQKAA